MPRRIDTQERTAVIAAAALRVLERDGLARLSVRSVAAEAQLATASLRRAFPTQHALREYCLELIEERVTARIAALELSGRALVDAMLAQLLPLDGERRMELAAQVQLGMLALTDDTLRPATAKLTEAVDRACHTAIDILVAEDQFASDRSPDYEAQRLHALLDGVAMRWLWSGTPDDSSQMLPVLKRHLDELARSRA